MNTQIIRINLQMLKNETHVQFNQNVNAVLEKFLTHGLGISDLYQFYKSSFDKELAALDFIKKSEKTAEIQEQDRVRDAIFRGFVDTVKGQNNHFEASRREAAEKLLNVFKHYGNIAVKTLDDETAAIDDIVREFKTPEFVDIIAKLRVGEWLEKLIEENNKFDKLMLARYEETAQKTPYRMSTMRVDTDKYYHTIVSQLENQLLINKDNAVLNAFIGELNAVITRYKNILAQETGRKNKN